MKILITGSNGQLGSEFRSLENKYRDCQFTFTDIEELDLTDFNAVHLFFEENSFDYCVNCAGYTAVDKAEEEPDKAFLLNANAIENLAKECTENNVRLLHISTDYVFNGNATRPYKEDDPVSPESVYGLSKLKGEEAVLKYSSDAIIIRTAWLCSRFGKNFVKTILRLGSEKNELNVVDDQLGSPTFTQDLANTILEITSSLENRNTNEIYHYSSEGNISWFIFAKAIIEIAGLNCEIKPVNTSEYPTKAKRPVYSVLDKGKIKNTFGFKIPDWKSSLSILIQDLKK